MHIRQRTVPETTRTWGSVLLRRRPELSFSSMVSLSITTTGRRPLPVQQELVFCPRRTAQAVASAPYSEKTQTTQAATLWWVMSMPNSCHIISETTYVEGTYDFELIMVHFRGLLGRVYRHDAKGQVLEMVKASRQYVSHLQSETLKYLTVSFRQHHSHHNIA